MSWIGKFTNISSVCIEPADHFPVKRQLIGIEQAQPSPEIFVLDAWEHFSQKHFVAVSVMENHLFASADDTSQPVNLVTVEVDQVIFTERRLTSNAFSGLPKTISPLVLDSGNRPRRKRRCTRGKMWGFSDLRESSSTQRHIASVCLA